MSKPAATAAETTSEIEAEAAAPAATEAEWVDIDPAFLANSRSPAPAFPLDALPRRFRDVVSGIATARQVNLDLVAVSTLAITAGAVGNRVRISITERRTEPANLFISLVVEPGDGKTEAIDIARESFNAVQAAANNKTLSVQPADHVLTQVEQRRNLDARKKLAAEGLSPVRDAAVAPSRRRQLLLSEATVAGVRDALAASSDGRVVVSDELLTVMNLSGGSEAIKARNLLLEAFDGKQHTIANARDGEITIEALQLTILGATQPDRVALLLGSAHDGMAPRFLWCAPDVVRSDEMAESDGPMDELIDALKRLTDIEPRGLPGAYPQLIAVSPEAREIFRVATAGWNERRAVSSTIVKSLLSRARTQALRLALNLALCERALAGDELPGGDISGADAERGVALMNRYFLAMGERVVTEFNRREIEPPVVLLARHLARLRKEAINVRDDLRRGLGSPIRDAEDIGKYMEELRLRGVVRPRERATQSGRPAKNWSVNPKLWKIFPTLHV
jgi:hypothetical protein